jgi:hypothetical protein
MLNNNDSLPVSVDEDNQYSCPHAKVKEAKLYSRHFSHAAEAKKLTTTCQAMKDWYVAAMHEREKKGMKN